MHECSECNERIAHPICPDCLSEGIACWVGERLGSSAGNAVFEITGVLSRPYGESECIKCHKVMSVCSYCYTTELLTILEKHPVIMAQFVFHFGFEDSPRLRRLAVPQEF